MNIGTIIKHRRKKIDVSAEQLAAQVGVSPATIYRYENGDIEKLPVSALEPIAKALNCTPAYLMGWEENPNSPWQNEVIDKEEQNLIKKYRSLDDHGKKNIDTLLDSEYERCREEREAYERDPRSDREILDEILNSTTTYIAAFGGDKELRTETMEEVIETLEILEDIVKKEKEQENKD